MRKEKIQAEFQRDNFRASLMSIFRKISESILQSFMALCDRLRYCLPWPMMQLNSFVSGYIIYRVIRIRRELPVMQCCHAHRCCHGAVVVRIRILVHRSLSMRETVPDSKQKSVVLALYRPNADKTLTRRNFQPRRWVPYILKSLLACFLGRINSLTLGDFS